MRRTVGLTRRFDPASIKDMVRLHFRTAAVAGLVALAGAGAPPVLHAQQEVERAVSEASQAAPEETEEAAPESQRPQPCLDGTAGPVRLQVGAVEAATEVGMEIPIGIRAKGVCDLASFVLGIQLDRHVAEVVRVEPAPFILGDPPVELEFHGFTLGAPAQVIRVARPEGSGGVDGIGNLVQLILRGRTPGATNITLVRPKLYDSAGKLIESYSVPVRLTVLEKLRWPGRKPPQRKPPSP